MNRRSRASYEAAVETLKEQLGGVEESDFPDEFGPYRYATVRMHPGDAWRAALIRSVEVAIQVGAYVTIHTGPHSPLEIGLAISRDLEPQEVEALLAATRAPEPVEHRCDGCFQCSDEEVSP